MIRENHRKADCLREVSLETGFNPHAEGSCLIKMGETHILCTATVESTLPPFLRGGDQGWIMAEYGMLPRATGERISRKRSMESGRTLEIQRLIGRSLRAVVDLKALTGRQIRIDCDVIQADGGTRTASIVGAYVALKLAERWMQQSAMITGTIVREPLTAISCGVVDGNVLLDLDYREDAAAQVDANFVLTKGGIVEIQSSAEDGPFSQSIFEKLLSFAQKGCLELFEMQRQALTKALP